MNIMNLIQPISMLKFVKNGLIFKILPNGTKLSNPSSFTASILGDYTVKYTVENERGASASVENIVTVVQRGSSMIGVSNKASIYSRYISNEVLVDGNNALDTLESQSIYTIQSSQGRKSICQNPSSNSDKNSQQIRNTKGHLWFD